MENYLNKGIKDVITEFPAVGGILEEFDIGCGPCMVGTCLLKDVVQIHQLPPGQEQVLMARIEKAIYPDRDIATRAAGSDETTKLGRHLFSPPMAILVGEHQLIKRWLVLIPTVVAPLDLAIEADRQIIAEGLEFIRHYADRLHHGKEEDILFAEVDDSSEIFQVIYADHRLGRRLVKQMSDGLSQHDTAAVVDGLTAYRDLLTEHIRKEDEILFPWMDSQLTADRIETLLGKFRASDEAMGIDVDRYRQFVEKLESRSL